jgi:ferritin-like protein
MKLKLLDSWNFKNLSSNPIITIKLEPGEKLYYKQLYIIKDSKEKLSIYYYTIFNYHLSNFNNTNKRTFVKNN